jgi:AcrR family transcriptional regulator
MRRSAAQTREHVLAITQELFYWQGIRATGVDQIAARAEVAPTTLYRLFASKDDLVAAYVQRADEQARAQFDAAARAAGGDAAAAITAVFDAQAGQFAPDQFRGCACLMTLAEYPDEHSPAHQRAAAGKQWVRDRFGQLTAGLPVTDPAALADELTVIFEGANASAQALGAGGPAARTQALARKVLAAAV